MNDTFENTHILFLVRVCMSTRRITNVMQCKILLLPK
jgi:hypothetical protein